MSGGGRRFARSLTEGDSMTSKREQLNVRVAPEVIKLLSAIQEELQARRGPGAAPVSQSEALSLLIHDAYGREVVAKRKGGGK